MDENKAHAPGVERATSAFRAAWTLALVSPLRLQRSARCPAPPCFPPSVPPVQNMCGAQLDVIQAGEWRQKDGLRIPWHAAGRKRAEPRGQYTEANAMWR